MFKMLQTYGIPDILVTAIRNMYRDTQAKVLSPDSKTRNFGIQASVLRGDTLAPYLFVIVLYYVLKRAITNNEEKFGFTCERQSRRIKPSFVTDCDFADDIFLMSNEINQAQKFFNELEKIAKEVGLHINREKTKFLSLNRKKYQKSLKRRAIKSNALMIISI